MPQSKTIDELLAALHDAAGAFSLLSATVELSLMENSGLTPEKIKQQLQKSQQRMNGAMDRASRALHARLANNSQELPIAVDRKKEAG